jgi:hypothetical protein
VTWKCGTAPADDRWWSHINGDASLQVDLVSRRNVAVANPFAPEAFKPAPTAASPSLAKADNPVAPQKTATALGRKPPPPPPPPTATRPATVSTNSSSSSPLSSRPRPPPPPVAPKPTTRPSTTMPTMQRQSSSPGTSLIDEDDTGPEGTAATGAWTVLKPDARE